MMPDVCLRAMSIGGAADVRTPRAALSQRSNRRLIKMLLINFAIEESGFVK